jgi:adenine-specific DNA-methyltransferase
MVEETERSVIWWTNAHISCRFLARDLTIPTIPLRVSALIQLDRKRAGAFYTPEGVARMLTRWAVRLPSDRLLDPSCGDGRFLATHRHSFGIDQDPDAVAIARQVAPHAVVRHAEFFSWASTTGERFDCAAGNPPFIRYQQFTGVRFTSLTSSWAPFLAATASLLKPGGRMSFVVPAEVGHAPYAKPLLEFLMGRFGCVRIVAVRDKIFPELSEDVWLLHAEEQGESTEQIEFATREGCDIDAAPPTDFELVSSGELESWGHRLRPFVLARETRGLYRRLAEGQGVARLGNVAQVGIGYVTGANDFFHLRPSIARRANIPRRYLHPAVRNARSLPLDTLTEETVDLWLRRDDPVLLFRLPSERELPSSVVDYLDSADGRRARKAYKCRVREPWYVVPQVRVPEAFLSYMCGTSPVLVANNAGCVGTNSVHAVSMRNGFPLAELRARWQFPFTQLSCELEGHPLGGGMLKLEPGEAGRVILLPTSTRLSASDRELIEDGIATMRGWRHYG